MEVLAPLYVHELVAPTWIRSQLKEQEHADRLRV